MVVNPYRSAEPRVNNRVDFCQISSGSSSATPTTGRRWFSTRIMVLIVVICLFIASYIFHAHHHIANPDADLNPPKLRGSISEDFKAMKRSDNPTTLIPTTNSINSRTGAEALTEEELEFQKRSKTREQLENHNQPSPFLVHQPIKPTARPTSKPTAAPTAEPTEQPTVASTSKATKGIAKLSLPEEDNSNQAGSKPSISIGNRAQLDQMKENVIDHINSRKQHLEGVNAEEGSHPVIDVSVHMKKAKGQDEARDVVPAAPAGLEKIDYNSNKVINEPPAVEPLQLPKGASTEGDTAVKEPTPQQPVDAAVVDAAAAVAAPIPNLEHNQKIGINIPLDHRQKPEVAEEVSNHQPDPFIHELGEKIDRHREVIVEAPLEKAPIEVQQPPKVVDNVQTAQPPHHLPPKAVESRSVEMPVQADFAQPETSNLKPSTGFDIPSEDVSKLRTKGQLVGTQATHKEKIDYCATQEDPFAAYSVDTFRPPPSAPFEAALQWRSAVKDMMKKITKLQIGGNQLRERIQQEADQLKVLRFKLFCKYA